MTPSPQDPQKEIIGYNCAVCRGANIRESGDIITHICSGVLEPVEAKDSPHDLIDQMIYEFRETFSVPTSKDNWTPDNYPHPLGIIDWLRRSLATMKSEGARAVLELAKDHYWDSLEPQRNLVVSHIEALVESLALTPEESNRQDV